MLINLLIRVARLFLPNRAARPLFPQTKNEEEEEEKQLWMLLEKARTAHHGGALHEALHAYESSLQLIPESQAEMRAAAMVNMSVVLRELVRMPEAVSCLRNAVSLQPGSAVAHYNLGLSLYEIGEARAAEASLDIALSIQPDFQAAHSTRLCLYGLARNHESARVLTEHQEWARRYADPLTKSAPPHLNERSLERQLTVGYVSADFKEHSIARFISPILANHDRSRFRVVCYDNWPKSDSTTDRLRTFADVWRKICGLDDQQVAELIRHDDVDILIDLSGHTTGNRLMVFAKKPAPIQANWLGYMSTTGMAAMDWHITDTHLDPPGVTEHWYSERLMRIVSAAAFEPHPESPPISSRPAVQNGCVRFGSFNNYTKIGDEVISLWGRLLAAVPDSTLLLVAMGGDDVGFQALVRSRFERLAPGKGLSSRVDVMGNRPLKEFLRLFHQVDIALDPFPYGGGTTSLHTLWMGVPVVTMEGTSELGRGTSGVLMACDLNALVASDEEEYVRIAMELATSPSRLENLRLDLRDRLSKSVVGNGLKVTRSLEEGYLRMWKNYVRGH